MGSCSKRQVESPNEQESKTKCEWVQGPIIVGAGPSGLAVAATLSHQYEIPYVILEKSHSIAFLWKHRTYDCLKLHLPKNLCHLPFMPFPLNFPKYPSKHNFISYMESYASRFCIHPRFNQCVRSAEFDPRRGVWVVTTSDDFRYISPWLVVATGENAEPVVPVIAGLDKFGGALAHSSMYKSGSSYKGKRVLVIGCGNSGMEVSFDLSRHNAIPHMVARNTVHILPREIFGASTFGIAMALLKWLPVKLVDKLLLFVATFIWGKTEKYGIRRPKMGPIQQKLATGKTPVLDFGQLAQIKSGNIKVMEGVKEMTKNGARFIDGQEMEFDAIIMATGYKSNVPSWLKNCEFFTKEGIPKKPFPNGWKGENGLYAAGFTGRGLLGTAFDAVKIAKDIADQWNSVNKEKKRYCNSHIILIKNSQ